MEKKQASRKNSKPSQKKEIGPAGKQEKQKERELAPYEYFDPWRDVDRMFERLRNDWDFPLWPMRPFPRFRFPRMYPIETMAPSVDLEDRGKDFLLTAELPGFKKEDVDVQITNDSVEIKAMTDWKKDERAKSYVRKERGSRSFHRIIRLPEEVVTNTAEANLKDGVLEIILSKKAPKTKKKITVK